MNEQELTDDVDAWWELDHEFVGYMTTRNRSPKEFTDPAEEAFTAAFYDWFLEYCRGLDQCDFVALVQRYSPELLKMVEA